ncbi:hypothetical protein ACFJIY_08665 [Pimelobacter simplex]|uniref:hypothetical protein n=1 Tax=Nocardioides simplex TaxID=2045 RepID=UPI00366A56E4
MRITRIITAFVAAFTAAMLGLTMAPSQAATGVSDRAAATPKHQIQNLQAGEIRNSGRFYAKGTAVTYRGKKILLQRKNKGARNWNTVQKKRTAASGNFQFKFRGKCGSKWRLVLKASGGYAKTKVTLGKIICY